MKTICIEERDLYLTQENKLYRFHTDYHINNFKLIYQAEKNISQIQSSRSAIIVLDEDGAVYSVTPNVLFHLEQPRTNLKPLENIPPVKEIATNVGSNFFLALCTNGDVYTCYDSKTQKINELRNIRLIGNGKHFMVAISNTHEIYCGKYSDKMQKTGIDENFQLNKIEGIQECHRRDICAVDVGYEHAMVLTSKGAVYGFGYNTNAQFGDEKSPYSEWQNPIRIKFPEAIKELSSPFYQSTAISELNNIYIVGDNLTLRLRLHRLPEGEIPLHCYQVPHAGSLVIAASGKVYAVGNFAGRQYEKKYSMDFPYHSNSLEHLNYPKLEMAVRNAVSEILALETPKKEVPIEAPMVANTGIRSLLGWLSKDEKPKPTTVLNVKRIQ